MLQGILFTDPDGPMTPEKKMSLLRFDSCGSNIITNRNGNININPVLFKICLTQTLILFGCTMLYTYFESFC